MNNELTLVEVQNEELKILKEVHLFCEENNIMYSVAYGTLLGTIRHKGFIPWDDDIDIIMHRPDYERFCETFVSNRYKLTVRPFDDDCLLAFARVYDDKTTLCDAVAPWNCKESGVFIDVFPADFVTDNEVKFKKQHAIMQYYWKKSTTARAALGRFRRKKSLLFNLKLIAKKVLFRGSIPAKKYIDTQMRKINNYNVGHSNHWSQLSFLDGYEYHNSSDFSDTSLRQFEDTEVRVMNGYHNVLTKRYGDYMQLPPVEKRKGHCAGMTMFYWK